jgi:primase-polymerase (primpol)-like protein
MPTHNYDKIPAELRDARRWVVYRLIERDGKITKVPYQPDGPPARTNDPDTWFSFESCTSAVAAGKFDGVGFVLTGSEYVGVDLDHVRDEVGQIVGWALAIVEQLASYTEISQSGAGLHVISHGTLPEGGHRKGLVEMYDGSSPRYFCVTGQHLEGSPLTIEERSPELAEIHATLFPPAPTAAALIATVPITMADDELIRRATAAANGARFRALWGGDWASFGYNSQSEADCALCSMLAFWTGNDVARIDRLFRLSGLMRPKWERSDYRERTIRKSHE